VVGGVERGGGQAGDAPVPDGLKLLAQLTLTGRVEARSGRGEVANGVADGTLELSRDSDEESDTLGSCASAVHSWSLSPR
jgi:hypothetical protein